MRLLPLIILILFSLGWVGRACAAMVLVPLFGHLVLQWPLGPTSHDRRTSESVAVAFGFPALPDPLRVRVADDPRRPDGLVRARRGSIHDPR